MKEASNGRVSYFKRRYRSLIKLPYSMLSTMFMPVNQSLTAAMPQPLLLPFTPTILTFLPLLLMFET